MKIKYIQALFGKLFKHCLSARRRHSRTVFGFTWQCVAGLRPHWHAEEVQRARSAVTRSANVFQRFHKLSADKNARRIFLLIHLTNCRFYQPRIAMQPSFGLQLLLLIAAVLFEPTHASCPAQHYPAPSRGDCVPCATMHQWQIMGETTGSAIVTALVRLDNVSKHVQCVTTSGLDCQWGRSELPGAINDTSTLIALGCDSLNRIYFPLRVYYGGHWCNSVWMFLFKYATAPFLHHIFVTFGQVLWQQPHLHFSFCCAR